MWSLHISIKVFCDADYQINAFQNFAQSSDIGFFLVFSYMVKPSGIFRFWIIMEQLTTCIERKKINEVRIDMKIVYREN
jgi:hypothetical protein